jgi:hypothetical protein
MDRADEPTRAPVCPVCGAEARVAAAPTPSACLPFPPVVPLRCDGCGNTGTELRLRGRAVVQWARGT